MAEMNRSVRSDWVKGRTAGGAGFGWVRRRSSSAVRVAPPVIRTRCWFSIRGSFQEKTKAPIVAGALVRGVGDAGPINGPAPDKDSWVLVTGL